MPTDQDSDLEAELRIALRELADETTHHAIAPVLAAPAVRRRRRTPVVVLAAAIALVVAAISVTVIIRTRDVQPARPPAPTGVRVAGNWSMVSTVDPPAGWRITQREVYQNTEQTVLEPVGSAESELSCSVVFESPGGDPPSGGASTTLAGRVGIYDAGSAATDSPGFSWAYDTNAWATVSCSGMKNPKSMIATVLAGVDRGFTEIHVPFRLAAVPADYRIEVIWDGSRSTDERGIDLGGTKDGATYPTGDILAIMWSDYDPETMLKEGGGSPERLDVNGRAWLIADYAGQWTACLAQRPNICVINQQGGGSREEIRDRMMKVMADVEPAQNLSDPSTWPSARDALPPQ